MKPQTLVIEKVLITDYFQSGGSLNFEQNYLSIDCTVQEPELYEQIYLIVGD